MKVSHLHLKNYRNYTDLDIDLSPNLNIFIGKNAQGKSNILESIFVLALTKSYMNTKDQNLIKDGADFSLIRATFFDNFGENQLDVIINSISKKLKFNCREIKKYSDYISKMKVLIFSPYNVNFVKDGPSVRRKTMNMVISQFSNTYVGLLQNYNVLLKKRNYFFRTFDSFKEYNQFYFDVLTERFSLLAVDIVTERKNYLLKLNHHLNKIYYKITGFEGLELTYVCNVEFTENKKEDVESLKKKLKANFERERSYGATLIGPHRDDFIFLLNGKDLAIYGSQGQIRAAILALKLAELLIFKEKDGEYPILLLDDIFSELDIEKRNRLVEYILDDVQTIITTTDVEMLDPVLLKKAKVFVVENGRIVDDGKKECKNE